VILLTKLVFFDTDCISAFLWVNNQCILTKLYPGSVVIPKQVYRELSHPTISHLKDRIDAMINNNEASLGTFDVGTSTYDLYIKMTKHPDSGRRII